MLQSMVNDINSILKKNGISKTIGPSNITITDKIVSDYVKQEQTLSNEIVDSIWPSIDEMTVYHYTSREAAESILNSNEFRFYSLLKRFDEQEIRRFCEVHDLGGYLDVTNGDPKYKTLIMDSIYYSSFTSTDLTGDQEEYFWKTFAAIDGVRLTLKVTASNPNFRKMIYEKTKNKPIKLLSELCQKIKVEYGRTFILSGVSRLCAFYLAKEFDCENEYRALYKSWSEFGPRPQTDGQTKYISIPLGLMSETGYKIEVCEIQTSGSLDIPCQYVVVQRGV